MIFEATGPYNAIGKIAMAQVDAALAAGWTVSVVAKRLDESLHSRVRWLKLFVPRRLFALQWLTARHFIRRAAGDLSRFDVVHGHQPQIADLCHVFQCHFLTRAAYEKDCWLDSPSGVRRLLESTQKHAVLSAEDRLYRRWKSSTHMLFNSGLTRETFGDYYGLPPSEEILIYPSPDWQPLSPEERGVARHALGLPAQGLVLGFLGGCHERKGYKRVIRALTSQQQVTLAFGGLHTDAITAPELGRHFINLGLVENTKQFYSACDAIVVASYFEPFGYVVSEAASVGIPTIATDGVGALPHLLEYGAGIYWDGVQPLQCSVQIIADNREKFLEGCRRYTQAYSKSFHDSHLLSLYEAIARNRHSGVSHR